MVAALAADFAAIPDVSVTCLHDARLPPIVFPRTVNTRVVFCPNEAPERFQCEVDNSDFVFIIAPETRGHLLRKTIAVEKTRRRLLSPASETVARFGNKWNVYQHHVPYNAETGQGFRMPRTVLVQRGDWADIGLAYPLVAKPVDGCGSVGVQLLRSNSDMIDWSAFEGDAIVQEYCPGLAASVAYLAGPHGVQILRACSQVLSCDGRFRYLGGQAPFPESLQQRVIDLTHELLCHTTQGWVGVDLILGEAADGSQDFVVEVNPRLTTSYIGLRALADCNLAKAMFDMALGNEPELRWKKR